MKLPVVRGTIDRRILANYRIDPIVMGAVLPQPFRPKIVNGFGIGGICLIRLKSIRPRYFPFRWGFGSENAAHRIAVEWDVGGEQAASNREYSTQSLDDLEYGMESDEEVVFENDSISLGTDR